MKRKKSIFRKKNTKKLVRKKRFRYLIRLGFLVVLLVGLGIGMRWSLTHLSLFSIRNITILGEPETLSRAEILKRAGVRTGTNLFSLNLDRIADSLQQHDFFKEIQVQRRLPHTLVIQVFEYRPAMILYTGRFYYVDKSGAIFKDITDTSDDRDQVIVTGISEEALLSQPLVVKKHLKGAGELREAYEKTPFAKKFGLSEIHFEKNMGYTLYPEKQKYSIKFGSKNFGEKTQKLSQVMEKLNQGEVRFSSIDLNYPGKVLMTL